MWFESKKYDGAVIVASPPRCLYLGLREYGCLKVLGAKSKGSTEIRPDPR